MNVLLAQYFLLINKRVATIAVMVKAVEVQSRKVLQFGNYYRCVRLCTTTAAEWEEWHCPLVVK